MGKVCRVCVAWMGQTRGRYTVCLKCGVWGLLGMLWFCRVLQKGVGGGLAHPLVKPYKKPKQSAQDHNITIKPPGPTFQTTCIPTPGLSQPPCTQQHKHDTTSQSHTPDPTTPQHINNDMAHTALIPGYRLYFAGLLPCTTWPPQGTGLECLWNVSYGSS